MSGKRGLVPIGDQPLLKGIAAGLTVPDPEPGAEAVAVIKRMQEVRHSDPPANARLAVSAELPDSNELICQLDLWPEPEGGSPNAFLRSALFAAIQAKTANRYRGYRPKRLSSPHPSRSSRRKA